MPEKYDVAVVGGGIAGPIAARYAAQSGLKTLLVEKKPTPRHKACSAIQFRYFQKLVGKKIPDSALCANTLNRIAMTTPAGHTAKIPFKILNFWRKYFDKWLCDLAEDAGAEFHDATAVKTFEDTKDGHTLTLDPENGSPREVQAKYLIAADGLYSPIRKRLRPQDFQPDKPLWALNWYYRAADNPDTTLKDNTMYMVWNVEYSTLMFAWIYKKAFHQADEEDLWCIGGGMKENPRAYLGRFQEYVREKHGLTSEVVKREGFTQIMHGGPWLGRNNLLMAGDAAGLIDLSRGVCMDAAALSARLAVKGILQAEGDGIKAVDAYQHLMRRRVAKIERNRSRLIENIASNKALSKYIRKFALKGGMGMLFANQLNRILPWNRLIFMPT